MKSEQKKNKYNNIKEQVQLKKDSFLGIGGVFNGALDNIVSAEDIGRGGGVIGGLNTGVYLIAEFN